MPVPEPPEPPEGAGAGHVPEPVRGPDERPVRGSAERPVRVPDDPGRPARGRRTPAREVASFRWAGRGVRAALAREPHLRFHAFATVVVTVLAVVLPLPATQGAVLLLAVGLVWVAELVNTAVERLVDLVSPEHHPLAGLVKDVAAGAVLVAAVVAAGVGALVLGPPLLDWVTRLDPLTRGG